MCADMETCSPSERQLLEQLSQEDSTAFWQLWIPYQKDLYHRCLDWMHGDVTEAQDALSRTMLKANGQLFHHAKNITNLKAWLIRFTHNVCIDIYRERRRSAVSIDDFDAITNQLEGVFTVAALPISAMLNSELDVAIKDAINTLPPRLRSPFIMHFEQEISYLDIAQTLDISIGNVYKRISQARTILKGYMNTYLIEDWPSNNYLPNKYTVFLSLTEKDSKNNLNRPTINSPLPPIVVKLEKANTTFQAKDIQCPYCQSEEIRKNGHRSPGLFHSKESFEKVESLSRFTLSLSHIVKAMVSIQIEG